MGHPFTGGTIDAYLAGHGSGGGGNPPGGAQQGPGVGEAFSGWYSILDGNPISVDGLAGNNLVFDNSGLVFQAIMGEGPFAGQVQGYTLAPKWLQEEVTGRGGDSGSSPGSRGPTTAELAIERSRVQSQNLATFITGTIAELEAEIASKRLSTEQALGEFNKRLDAFSEAGTQFVGIQPFTVTPGSEFLPGRQPGGIGEAIGRPVQKANPIFFDPFGMAQDIVNESPSLTDIGVPSGAALDEAIAVAKGFI